MSTWLASWLAGAASFAGMAALALAMDRHYLQSTGNDEVPRLQRQVLRSVGAVLLAAVFIPCVQAWGGTVGMVVSLGFWSLGALMVAGVMAASPRLAAALAAGLALLAIVGWAAAAMGFVTQ